MRIPALDARGSNDTETIPVSNPTPQAHTKDQQTSAPLQPNLLKHNTLSRKTKIK